MHRQSRGKIVALSARDLAVFKVLSRYRYLPSNFLHAFVPGNAGYHETRMTDLFHEGWLNRPRQQWAAINARYRPAIAELDTKGQQALIERGIIPGRALGNGGSFTHELMVCLIMASFELGARNTGLQLVSPELAHSAPRANLAPAGVEIRVSITHDGKNTAFDLKPDGYPFGLASANRRLWFPGFEADRHTEPLHVGDLERSSILKKVLAYREMVAADLYRSHLGFTNMLVPIITVNERHMQNMIAGSTVSPNSTSIRSSHARGIFAGAANG